MTRNNFKYVVEYDRYGNKVKIHTNMHEAAADSGGRLKVQGISQSAASFKRMAKTGDTDFLKQVSYKYSYWRYTKDIEIAEKVSAKTNAVKTEQVITTETKVPTSIFNTITDNAGNVIKPIMSVKPIETTEVIDISFIKSLPPLTRYANSKAGNILATRKVVQFTLSGQPIKIWNSLNELIGVNKTYKITTLKSAITGKSKSCKSAYGYQWRWLNAVELGDK